MREIKSFKINTFTIPGVGGSRKYIVTGDPGAVFSVIVVDKDGKFYNFPENTIENKVDATAKPSGSFSSTPAKLFNQKIDSSGVYNSSIFFPSVSDDNKYTLVLQAESGFDTTLDKAMSLNNVYHAAEIEQFEDTTVTVAVASSGSSGTYTTNPPAANKTFSGQSSNVSPRSFNQTFSFSYAVALGSSQFIIARQPVINDFYFTTTKRTKTAGTDSTSLELKDITGLSVGMGVSGTGIASAAVINTIIPGYKDNNLSTPSNEVFVIPKTVNDLGNEMINSSGGTVIISAASVFVVDRAITFKGYGSESSSLFNKTTFSVSNFKLAIDPVVTTTDAIANSTTIPLTSTNGIKAADTVLMTGIGVKAASPHVDTVNANVSVVVSVAQTIENGQTVTFTGSSRTATITGDIEIEKYGKDNLTLTIELDNILTVG